MLDETKPLGRLVAAAMRIAAVRAWKDLTLSEIATAAGMGLADLREHVASKSDLIAAFMRAIDDDVLRKAIARPADPARDRLFDVIMLRFDALQPYKPALKSIAAAGLTDIALTRPFLASQHWMLQAAGITTEGALGGLKVAGLGSVYASTLRTWLDDDDPGMAKTMAALDRRLRRGEQSITAVEDTASGIVRVARDLPGVLSSLFKRRPNADEKPKEDGAPGSAAP